MIYFRRFAAWENAFLQRERLILHFFPLIQLSNNTSSYCIRSVFEYSQTNGSQTERTAKHSPSLEISDAQHLVVELVFVRSNSINSIS